MASSSAKGGTGWTSGAISLWEGFLSIAVDCPRKVVELPPLEGVQEMTGCVTQGHGLMDRLVFSHSLDSMICGVVSNLNHSVIL